MHTNLPYLVNLPPFIFRGENIDEYSLLKKIYFIIFGKFISLVVNKTSKKLFCNIINLFFSDSDIYYENGYYIKKLNGNKIYFPNKRVLRLVKNPLMSLEKIYKTYCLDFINFEQDDLIIDCGANVGELNTAIKYFGYDLKYIGFEPDKKTYECLVKNDTSEQNEYYEIALSNLSGQLNFYLDNEGGNSSLEDFGADEKVVVDTKKLDDYDFKNIKLLKIDAEGHEPEVLVGALNTLNEIQYISVDFGAERGIKQENTIPEVNNLLYSNNFELVKFSKYRLIGLYKNKKEN